jgi:hypothetical protein
MEIALRRETASAIRVRPVAAGSAETENPQLAEAGR